jgi:4-amino-4-deoxy-L-arabinose transferase-like glycosyltransferase
MPDRFAEDLIPDREEWLTIEEAAGALGLSAAELADRIHGRSAHDALPEHLVQQHWSELRIHRSLVHSDAGATIIPMLRAEVESLHDAIRALTDEVRVLRTELKHWSNAIDAGRHAERTHRLTGTKSRIAARLSRLFRFASSTATFRYVAGTTVVACLLGWMLLSNVGANPAGLFCDEAGIGIRTHELVTQDLPALRPKLFYQIFSYAHLGALPLYASAPVIAVLGLSDMSVRLVSVIWSVAALLMLVALVRQLRWRNGEIAVVLFACTPVFIHFARINFGHAPSLFCVCSGLYAYARGRDQSSWRWSALAGFALAASIYGQPAYYIAAPVILSSLAIGELFVNARSWRAYRPLGAAISAFALAWVPVIIEALSADQFLNRFRDKDMASVPLLSTERLGQMLHEYPKYFSPDYLFRIGEVGLPGGWILRHSVPGAGILTWIALPLILAGIIAIFRTKDATGRVLAMAGLVVLVLYPVPDLPTTTSLNAPYTFSVYSTLIFVPLLAGLGVHWLSGLVEGPRAALWSSWLLPVGLLAVMLVGATRFYTGPYDRYPLISAEYDGWQYGAGPAIAVFEQHPETYDRYFLDGHFNGAFVFLDFYLVDNQALRQKAMLGGIENVDVHRRDLYAIRAHKYNALMSSPEPLRRYTKVIDAIRFPSGEIALYLVEISANSPREISGPF